MPARLALITTVGPPDWAANRFPASSAIKTRRHVANRVTRCQNPFPISFAHGYRQVPAPRGKVIRRAWPLNAYPFTYRLEPFHALSHWVEAAAGTLDNTVFVP